MKINLKVSNYLNNNRDAQVSMFRNNVSNGLHNVAYFNSAAAQELSFGKEGFMSASNSFGLASETSLNKASFCENMLTDMKTELQMAELLMQRDAKKMMLNHSYKFAAPGAEKTNKIQENKQQEAEQAAQSSLGKAYSDLSENLKTLEEFNSDADIRFKTFKQQADNQNLIAKKKYFNFIDKLTQSSVTKELNSNSSKKNNSIFNEKNNPTDGIKMFAPVSFTA